MECGWRAGAGPGCGVTFACSVTKKGCQTQPRFIIIKAVATGKRRAADLIKATVIQTRSSCSRYTSGQTDCSSVLRFNHTRPFWAARPSQQSPKFWSRTNRSIGLYGTVRRSRAAARSMEQVQGTARHHGQRRFLPKKPSHCLRSYCLLWQPWPAHWQLYDRSPRPAFGAFSQQSTQRIGLIILSTA